MGIFCSSVEVRLFTGINQNEAGCGVVSTATSAEQDIVPSIPLVKLPWSFEELKEFPHDFLFRGICKDTNHYQEPSAQGGYRFLMGPKPFFEDDKAKEDFMIVVPPSGMLLEQFAYSLRAKILVRILEPPSSSVSAILLSITPRNQSSTTFDGESPLRPFHNRLRQVGPANLPVATISGSHSSL